MSYRKNLLSNNTASINLTVGRDNLIQLAETLLEPLCLALTVWGIAYYYERSLPIPYLLLSLLIFAVSFPGRPMLHQSLKRCAIDILSGWLLMASLILFFGYATRSLEFFMADAIRDWIWISPLALFSAQGLLRLSQPLLRQLQGNQQRAIIIGMNTRGLQLAERIAASPYSNLVVAGFFDDRADERIASTHHKMLLGRMNEAARYAKENRIQRIYISLPMSSQPRILAVLDELRDTTASVYFVPDLFMTDIIQGRVDEICSMPVVSVCETPFTGTNGLIKRGSDIIIASIILALIAPVLIIIAIAVKLSSPGPIIFKQRRYGLEGEEILVYKFRSMTVTEDGPTITQAQKNDKRVTRVGGFLRKTSLDELPQFINVLQGRMSIVGPRPHAVAHNELYRGLIKGYMVRHKVKPGITGWAQVNGLRGETDTLDKMQARIEYDLDYLRHWSLGLDLKIILMTVGVVFKDQYAY